MAEKKERGRPSMYSDALVDKLCEEIATSDKGLHKICQSAEYPSVAIIMRWLSDGKHPYLVEQYARAKQLQAEYLEDQLLTIADDASNDTLFTEDGRAVENREFISRSRLRIDTRKWLMSKLLPKKYGDKLDVKAEFSEPVVIEVVRKNLNKPTKEEDI